MTKRLVYICDWLPPDFGAVGQYAVIEAREWATAGWNVTLVGLTSGDSSEENVDVPGNGTIETIRVHRPAYEKQRFWARLRWTVASNTLLILRSFGRMRRAEAILFTGSPPLMLHMIAPLNLLLRRQLIYRIMDFHPECLIAERGKSSFLLDVLLSLTYFWRRRIDMFQVLGHDQARRLMEIGIPSDRIALKFNSSPVSFSNDIEPLPLPAELRDGAGVILYSGNWGVAHDETTFIEAYTEYSRVSKQGLRFWLNATGAKADRVEGQLRAQAVAMHRSNLVPLEELPRLLMTADVHLITLRDSFVGFVLPSKIHACIESGKRIIFIGSESSDVHRLASNGVPTGRYWRVDVGDVRALVEVLKGIEDSIVAERRASSASSETPMPALGSS